MSFSNTLTAKITAVEEWIAARRLPLICSPIRLLASAGLLLLLIVANLIAVTRWPFAALWRMRRRSESSAPRQPLAVDETALQQLLQQPYPVLVDFWAEWCGPCLLLSQILDEFAERHADEVVVAKVNTMQHVQLAKAHQVNALPALVLFRDGREVKRHLGPLTLERLEEFVFADADAERGIVH